jgi:hypothetical protein
MIIVTERKRTTRVRPMYLTEAQYRAIKQAGLLEATTLPAVVNGTAVSTDPKITQVVRQDTIFNTLLSMGLSPYINKLGNVVVEVKDLPTMMAVMQKIYQSFGVRGSMVIPWDGLRGKVYYDPKEKPNQANVIAYARATGLPPPNPHKYLA